MPHDTPVAMPNIYQDMTLEDYFKRLQEIPNVFAKQVAGSHYQEGTIQPWEIISDWKLDFWTGNVIKYLLRFPYKNGKEDLEKALHYLEYLINNYDDVKEKYYMDKDTHIKSMKA